MSNASLGQLTLPPRRPKTADTLLVAASHVIIEQRTLDIDFGAIAVASGVSKALIRYHFGSLSGLLRALAVRDAAEMMSAVRQLLQERVTDATIERSLATIIRLHLARPYGPALMRRAIRSGWEDVGIAEARSVFGAIREVAKQGRAVGAFRGVDPLLVYMEIVAACDTLFLGDSLLAAIAAAAGVETPTDDQIREHMVERILAGVRLYR